MKTLDEVIGSITTQSGLEIRDVRKPEKDRFWVDRETYNNALQYLKEYREKLNILEVQKAEYKRGFEQLGVEWARIKDNHPLTWSELKQMEGKPVWVEYNFRIRNKEFRDKSKRWCIVREIKPWNDTEIIITDNGFVLSKREQVKDWQAYRKERADENA